MASYSVAASEIGAQNKTLTASTVDTVTFAATVSQVEVVNLDGAAAIYFTVDGSTPTVGGAGTYVVPAAIGSVTAKARGNATGTSGQNPSLSKVVKLISVGTPAYSVQDAS